MSDAAALVDEIANELEAWPGVHTERRADGAAVIRYEQLELGVLDRDRGVAELRFSHPVHEQLVEHGDAEPADPAPELFDRRYRDLRGEDEPYSSQDPA